MKVENIFLTTISSHGFDNVLAKVRSAPAMINCHPARQTKLEDFGAYAEIDLTEAQCPWPRIIAARDKRLKIVGAGKSQIFSGELFRSLASCFVPLPVGIGQCHACITTLGARHRTEDASTILRVTMPGHLFSTFSRSCGSISLAMGVTEFFAEPTHHFHTRDLNIEC